VADFIEAHFEKNEFLDRLRFPHFQSLQIQKTNWPDGLCIVWIDSGGDWDCGGEDK